MSADVRPAGVVTRQLTIGPHRVAVIDGLFADPAIASLFAFLKQLPYRLKDYDSEASSHVRHWIAEFPGAMVEGTPILRDCIRLTSEHAAPAPLTLVRAQANLVLYGDMMFPHQDSDTGVTSLYYANPVWDEAWQGETVFYEAGEPLHTVAPRPGRVVIFDGALVHRVGVPSRDCYLPRITVAFKFARARS